MPLLRIPYTDPLPQPRILPHGASSLTGTIAALVAFLDAAPSPLLRPHRAPSMLSRNPRTTLLLTGAGVSVASGLADYRGPHGTYTLNKTYRPIYYAEFVAHHDARRRYWARSFLGWTTLSRARPNAAHVAIGRLGAAGILAAVITQNVDSFHAAAHPRLPTIELHGRLARCVCLSCRAELERADFQRRLAQLNPAWDDFLRRMLATGALATESPGERHARGLRTNPDGDVDVSGVDYRSFRYPACPACAQRGHDATGRVDVDADGALVDGATAGVLKPGVVMFGESIPTAVKTVADEAVDAASRLLVVGSSLATYSAWRLVKRARDQGMPIGIVNMGGVRGEAAFFDDVPCDNDGRWAVRSTLSSSDVLPSLVQTLRGTRSEFDFDINGIGADAVV